MAARGMPDHEIAQALFLSVGTVHTIVGSVTQRLGVNRDGLRAALSPG